MSERVQIDLDALIDFRNHLLAFNETLRDEYSRMKNHWLSMADYWHDAKYDEFGEALEDVNRGIERYLEITPDHETHLYNLIERVRAVLDTRI
jgi:hypothetical protein